MSAPTLSIHPSKNASRRQNLAALLAVCLASLMFGLEISSVPVILPTLERVLHSNFEQLQWIMNAYTLACTTILMAAGTLADRFGRRLIFSISIVAFGITSLVCGLARSSELLIVFRFLQGLSGGAMLICQVAILSHQFQAGSERAHAFSVWGVVFGIGLGFGPIIGGAIIALVSWQWVFMVHAVIAAATLALVFTGVKESRDPHAETLDLAGIVLLSVVVFGLVYYISQGAGMGFASPIALTIVLAVVLSFAGFLWVEQSRRHPMVDFSVFRIRHFSGALFGSIGMNFSFWPFMIYLPIYFQLGLGLDVVTAGLALLSYTLPTLVFPPLGERLALRYHASVVIPLGLFIIGGGFLLMKLGMGMAEPSWRSVLPGCLLAGIGLGITNTPVTNATTGALPPHRAGMASSIDMSARMISLALNIAVMGFIVVAGIIFYLRQAMPSLTDNETGLRVIAERLAAGNTAALAREMPALTGWDPTGAITHAALMHGFGLLALYGGISAWAMALLSRLVFGSRKLKTA